jgi:hypothetical protein
MPGTERAPAQIGSKASGRRALSAIGATRRSYCAIAQKLACALNRSGRRPREIDSDFNLGGALAAGMSIAKAPASQ